MNDKELEKRIEQLEKQVAELKAEKPHHEFKVGDRVQFKSWEEMENKYGLDSRAEQATIKTNPRFLNSMSYLCGTYATIKEIKENGVVELKDFTTGYTNDLFSYSLDMLKPATDEPKFKVGDKVEAIEKNRDCYNRVGIIKDIDDFGIYKVEFEHTDYIHNIEEKYLEPYTEPRWNFTDDEKVILRNLTERYNWIARNKNNTIVISSIEPEKDSRGLWWDYNLNASIYLHEFNHLFQSIKWEDDEPCEFRKYL